MRLTNFVFALFSSRHVPAGEKGIKVKATRASNREAHAALGALTLGPFTSACFQSIAVTFGTATSSSIDVGYSKTENRSSLLFSYLFKN